MESKKRANRKHKDKRGDDSESTMSDSEKKVRKPRHRRTSRSSTDLSTLESSVPKGSGDTGITNELDLLATVLSSSTLCLNSSSANNALIDGDKTSPLKSSSKKKVTKRSSKKGVNADRAQSEDICVMPVCDLTGVEYDEVQEGEHTKVISSAPVEGLLNVLVDGLWGTIVVFYCVCYGGGVVEMREILFDAIYFHF